MKRQRLTLFLTLFCLTGIFSLAAQPQLQPLPIDPKVRYGTLDNGLTYFIRHNEYPKERAEFFIAQKVGSILEEDNQAGLAHFLEHMAFNGTKNLPGKQMISYLETIGVKFGENLNAYTSFDRTVYNISNVPVTREGIVDTCLLVLHDWSGFISLEDEEMEKERGVIREEMRSHSGAYMRQLDILLPQIMPGSQYAKRMPIGTEQVVMGFKPDELRAYYHKWYRPDLQGIIIIGDIDVDKVEAKIKKLFADIPKPVNPAKRIYYPVTNNDEPLVGISTDKEATNTQVSIYFKHEPMTPEIKASATYIGIEFVRNCVSQMLYERFNEIIQKANPPFIQAYGYDGMFFVAETKDAFTFVGNAKENETEKTLKALTTEIERVKRYGFTTSEYERAKIRTLKLFEKAYNERDKQKNGSYANEYVSYFTQGGSISGIESEYNLINQIAPVVSAEMINEQIKKLLGDKNIIISLTAPEKEGLTVPTKEQLLTWFNEARKADIQAFEDKVSNEPLISQLPKPGKIVSTTQDNTFGTTVFTLSNGVKAVIKTTKYKADEILMSASSPGGSSLFPETEATNIKMYSNIIGLGGLGKFSKVDLSKALAGKQASVSPTIDLEFEGFNGASNVKDFETMLQLTYLWFTAPRMDQEAYQSFLGRVKAQLESAEVEPMNAFMDTLNFSLYEDPIRKSRLTAADLKSLNYQTIMDWYKDRYKDASDFTFYFVGNIDPESSKPMIEQYLGSLPSIKRKETSKTVNANFKKGIQTKVFNKDMQTPKATVVDCYTGKMEYSLANLIKMNMLSQILQIVYTEKVREDESGTYGVSVSGNIASYPKGRSILQMVFETNDAKKEFLNNIVVTELNNLSKQEPRLEDFNKTKEFMLKKLKENEQENNYWRNIIQTYYSEGFDSYSTYLKTLNSITPADIQKFTKDLLSQKNSLEIIMNGIKTDKN